MCLYIYIRRTIEETNTRDGNLSRNQDSGKVFYLEKQEYVDSCETHDI